VTERGLPLADGAPACPFVAFDDDRDERASVPDHRHRCFAEAQPAPRALAHQEAYCLSAAFPVCPTFQDWARREAAHSRDGGRAAAPAAAVPLSSDRSGVPPAIVSPELARAAAAATASDVDDEDERSGHDPAPPPPRAADPEPDDPDDRHPDRSDSPSQRNPPRDWSAPPPGLASDEAKRRRAAEEAGPPSFLGHRAEPGQGLAGSPADRMAGGSVPGAAAERRRDRDHDEEWTSAAGSGGRGRPPAREPVEDDEEEIEDEPPRRSTRRPRAYSQHLGGPDGPDWERPRRYEAYPTIRSRVGLPRMRVRVPPIALMAAAIVVLMAALFFLPGVINLGGSGARPSASPSSAAAGPSASLSPTVPPAPTPVLYTIKKGDTLSKIATANGITLDELLAANPTIKDPNKIGLGQQIIIPAPSEEPPDTVGESPSASAAP
jgi:LysM repeat protein